MENSIELKKTVLAMIACVLMGLLSSACHGPAAGFAGTYVNHAVGEFSIADDTLVIAQGDDDSFLIHRKTGYNVLNESGKPGHRRYETEEWKAVYDAQKKVLETRKGLVISFSGAELLLENSRYRRTN
ncbi:hypothetical protein [Mucilaginibacter polytrichastri]|uniref:Uncharacterized protein n=1 Tax=Mucilaginibacter polytrichastri TaxID=1302689 RepID=A0A1Q5ZWJ0_9SPHI|nr:hypothetical protein [Mucilaginibacter polytrichastri]OKS86137.1 hypothetical protein RG47T_1587 [Mucilaginibacter polytrichastri]SFS58280.1 hypothetical protein SAMN04487890_1024 [Mucilaginibacter polytrichastri]